MMGIQEHVPMCTSTFAIPGNEPYLIVEIQIMLSRFKSWIGRLIFWPVDRIWQITIWHYVGRMEKRCTVGRNGNHQCRTRSRMFVFNGDFDLGSSRVFILEWFCHF